MTKEEIGRIVELQRSFFRTGSTLDIDYRLEALERLRSALKAQEEKLHAALRADLGKGAFESYMCETGMVLSEIGYMLRHTRSLARERTVPTPLAQFPARSYVRPSPYGTALIMSPWNYPLLLTLDPLVDAIAAGNTAVLKPSAYAPRTMEALEELIEACFSPEYVAVVTGGRAENTSLLEERFDYIFFTGSQAVGKQVMAKAAEHLTPVTLELGGKSPCIVDGSADLRLTARRIVFGKFLNCGQTCVAPDYIYCFRGIRDALAAALKEEIVRQFGSLPLENPNYGKIVNEKHYHRLMGLMDREKVIWGGERDEASLRIAPTLMDNVTFDDPVMGEEIFGPILPILTYGSLDEAIGEIQARPHPLALYIFTSDRRAVERVTSRVGFGGGCVNDVIIHLATPHMGFGGFGESGMGAYHGRTGFDAFSHCKSIVDKKTWLDLPMRYQPYQKGSERLLRLFLR